jgi:Mg2+-importing ATPase
MLPSQILLNNLIYDASQVAIPTDGIDPEEEVEPAKWDVHGIERFMIVFGPISSVFDFLTFGILLGVFHADETTFHTGWFIESLFTQVLVVLAIRTRRSPFWRSRPSVPLLAAVLVALAVTAILPLTPFAPTLGFVAPPMLFWPLLAVLVVAYLTIVEIVKRRVVRPAAAARVAPLPVPAAPAAGTSSGV